MPKSRLIEDWTEDPDVDKLDAHTERFYNRLKVKSDDYGRFHAEPLLLKNRLFPLKRDIRETDIVRWLAACEQADLIRFYVGPDSRKYLEVLKHKQRKQWMTSEHPPPEGQIVLPLSESKKIEPPSKKRSRREEKRAYATENHAERPTCAQPSPSLENKEPENTGILSPKLSPPVARFKREMWQLLSDEKALTDRINLEKEKTNRDPELIKVLVSNRTTIRTEMKTLSTPI
jgi:hypothetical protein